MGIECSIRGPRGPKNENTMVKLSLKEYTFLHKNRQDGALLEQLSQVTFDLRIKCFAYIYSKYIAHWFPGQFEWFVLLPAPPVV